MNLSINATSLILNSISFIEIVLIGLLVFKWKKISKIGRITYLIIIVLIALGFKYVYFDYSKQTSNEMGLQKEDILNKNMFERKQEVIKVVEPTKEKVKKTYDNAKSEIEKESELIHNGLNK